MASIVVGVCDSNVVFETGVLACLREDPTIDAVRVDPKAGNGPEFDVVVTSADHLDAPGITGPRVVCVDALGDHGDLAARDDIAAVLSRSSVTPDQLVGAVHAAGVGLRLTPQVNGANGIDDRSLAVLRLLADGASTRDIASELGYSERTVKAVISTIGARLGVRTRAQAVATALRRSLIS